MTIRRIFEVGPDNEYHFEPHQILVTFYPESGNMQVALRPRMMNTWAAPVACIDKQDDPPKVVVPFDQLDGPAPDAHLDDVGD